MFEVLYTVTDEVKFKSNEIFSGISILCCNTLLCAKNGKQ